MTCDTENKSLEEAFVFFVTQIQPKIQPYADRINRKLIDCPYTSELDQKQYFTYLRGVKKGGRLVSRRREWKSECLAVRADQSSGSYFFVEMFSSISRST